MYIKSKYNSVDEPVRELATLVYNHFGKTPMSWTGIDKLTEYAHGEKFARTVLNMHDFLVNGDIGIEGINPSQYYKIIYKFQLATKSMEIERDRIVKCYFDLANYSIDCFNNLYNRTSLIARNCNYIPLRSEMERKKIGYLCGLLRSYCETVYCDEHTIAEEILSPIIVDDGNVIASRLKYLNSQELNYLTKDVPVKEINIYIKYSKETKPLRTDIVGNLISDYNYSAFATGYYIEYVGIDNNVYDNVSINDLDHIVDYFSKLIRVLIRDFKDMTLEKRLLRKIDCECFALKPYLDIVGIDWRQLRTSINLIEIQKSTRPIVFANTIIEELTDPEDIMEKLLDLNDPRKHWTCLQDVFR